jgi:hypothetical protein
METRRAMPKKSSRGQSVYFPTGNSSLPATMVEQGVIFADERCRVMCLTATNHSVKAKRPNFVQPLKLLIALPQCEAACALQVFVFDFFIFFFDMTLFLDVTPYRKEQWLQRHECDMNGLWRIE